MNASIGRACVALIGLCGAATAFAACDSNQTRIVVGGSVMQPSPTTFASSAVFTQIQPQLLLGQRLVTFGCPTAPPLATTFQIVVQQPVVDVFLNRVTLRFLDGTGIGGTPIPFPTPDLNRMFGRTLVRAGTVRTFPFAPRFGCFPLAPTHLSARVVLADVTGAQQESTLTANVR